jgi:DNA polymerase alpha subunit B
VKQMQANPPNVIVLTGPFVDISHIQIQNGQIQLDQFEIFAQYVTPLLAQLKQNSEIVLIPSQQDSILTHIAFPQPPIGSSMTYPKISMLKKLGLVDQNGTEMVELYPNPVQFKINEMVIAVSKADVIADMFRTQLTRTKKFEHTFKNILKSRHFYPIFPPNRNICLDSTRALKSDMGSCVLQAMPDVLCLPSVMNSFGGVVENVVCVNPQKATMGNELGVYARLIVAGLKVDQISDDLVLENSVADRCRVEIVRL